MKLKTKEAKLNTEEVLVYGLEIVAENIESKAELKFILDGAKEYKSFIGVNTENGRIIMLFTDPLERNKNFTFNMKHFGAERPVVALVLQVGYISPKCLRS